MRRRDHRARGVRDQDNRGPRHRSAECRVPVVLQLRLQADGRDAFESLSEPRNWQGPAGLEQVVHGEFQFCQYWRVMCSLANGWIAGHGHTYVGDLRNRRPPFGNRRPSRRARRGSRRDRRVTPSQASAAGPESIAQKSPETDALGSVAFRYRCLPGLAQTPPKDCDWNQTVDASALSSGADPAEIQTAVHISSPSAPRAQRALKGTHRRDSRDEAP